MLQFIPKDIELFNAYINKTDDLQLTIREHTIYPKDAEGNYLFSSPDKKDVKEPVWQTWYWTEEESRQWSLFRQTHNELYNAYAGAKTSEKKRLQKLLNDNISASIEYDKEHKLVERILYGENSYGSDWEIFGLRQDKMQYETALRTITIHYEKQIPLSDLEKTFIEKYIALHNRDAEQYERLPKEIKELHDMLPELWHRISVAREKADLATNTICIPPPEMKGSFSPMVSMVIPTAEEAQKRVDDFNHYMQQFSADVDVLCARADELYKQVYNEDEDGDEIDPMYDEVESLHDELHKCWGKNSIDITAFFDEYEDYKGVSWDEKQKSDEPWSDFVREDNAFMDVFNELVGFLTYKFTPDENIPAVSYKDDLMIGNDPDYDDDDPQAETIQRYESGMGSPYFDVDEWHIILDHYEHKFDEKNKSAALEKAFTQHPDHATLLLRKAQEEMDKHEYKNALALLKQAEDQGPPHHPNLYWIKAGISCQVHAPEQAIPLYNKLIEAKGMGLEWFHENARYRLIDIYQEQKKYSECIRLTRELIEMDPEDDILVSNLSLYYRLNGELKEAEEAAKAGLEKFPESAACMEQLGHLYVETKEYIKAIELYESTYNKDKSENYGVLFHQGNAHIKIKHFSEAAASFETCLFHYHLDKETHLAAARCYTELKMPYAATWHYRKALEIDPECPEAILQLQQTGN